jgi:hypothetical protein
MQIVCIGQSSFESDILDSYYLGELCDLCG